MLLYQTTGAPAKPLLPQEGSLEDQVSLLGNPNLSLIQRQSIASDIGQIQGNQHLQEIISHLNQFESTPDRDEKTIKPIDLPDLLLIQRGLFGDDRSDEQLIEDAIRNRSVSDAKAIRNVNLASEDQKITLIDILSHQTWVGPFDEAQIGRLWNSFGRSLPRVMEAHVGLWNHCLSVGAELNDIDEVSWIRSEFQRDVRGVAAAYLAENRGIVGQEMIRLGISEEEETPEEPITAAQEREIHDMQQAARIVAQLQRGQEDLRHIPVGYLERRPSGEYDMGGPIPVLFDPVMRPDYPPNPEDRNMRPWAVVKEEYDRANAVIAALTDRFPALYSISREGQSAQTQEFANAPTPAAARAQLGPALRNLDSHIDNAQTMLLNGRLNPLDLLPIHEQLFAGMPATSGISWGSPLPHWAADQERAGHEAEQFWVRLGLTSLSAAAFILAPFTGGASLFVCLVGLGAAGAQAAISAERYEALSTAARTEVRSGTALVTPEQVSIAEQQMQADAIMLAIATLLVATGAVVGGVGAVTRALGGRTPSLRVLMGEARYAEYEEAIAAIKQNHPELRGIATEDLIAIRGYTAEDYAQLNMALRSGDPAELLRLQSQIRGAVSGLRQLPAHRGQVTRRVSLSEDMARPYQPGAVITEEAFTSASLPGGTYQRGGNTLMIIESTSGRNISLIARHVTEREVLFMPGTRLRVVSVEMDGHVIRMVEVGQ